MPFISSVGGALGGRVWSLSRASAPTVTMSAIGSTDFNHNRATFNGTVSANGAITTTIKFQISTNGGSTWNDATGGTTISNTSSQNVSVFYNATGLSVGTAYTVRLVATNSVGTTNSSTRTFTTWALRTFDKNAAGTWTFTIPTYTPTGGTAVVPEIFNIMMFGGGGGGNDGGGGGGAEYQLSSTTVGGTREIQAKVGGAGTGTAGGAASTLSGHNSGTLGSGNLSVAGGGGGNNTNGARTGSSGDGNLGGITSVTSDKNGVYFGAGGGGGAGGIGGDGYSSVGSGYGGAGGAAVTLSQGGVSRTGGAGGAGIGSTSNGSTPTSAYGTGGVGFNATGVAGMVYFQYYAASVLA